MFSSLRQGPSLRGWHHLGSLLKLNRCFWVKSWMEAPIFVTYQWCRTHPMSCFMNVTGLAQPSGMKLCSSQLWRLKLDLSLLIPLPILGYIRNFFGRKKMKRGNRGKKVFIAANAFFWPVSVLNKCQKNYFGGRFSPTPVAEKWCPALYTLCIVHRVCGMRTMATTVHGCGVCIGKNK